MPEPTNQSAPPRLVVLAALDGGLAFVFGLATFTAGVVTGLARERSGGCRGDGESSWPVVPPLRPPAPAPRSRPARRRTSSTPRRAPCTW